LGRRTRPEAAQERAIFPATPQKPVPGLYLQSILVMKSGTDYEERHFKAEADSDKGGMLMSA
jgi:hypothetical protein